MKWRQCFVYKFMHAYFWVWCHSFPPQQLADWTPPPPSDHFPFSAFVLITSPILTVAFLTTWPSRSCGKAGSRRTSCFPTLYNWLFRKWTLSRDRKAFACESSKWETERVLLGFHKKFLVDAVGEQVLEWLGGDSGLEVEEDTAKESALFPQETEVTKWLHDLPPFAGKETSQ